MYHAWTSLQTVETAKVGRKDPVLQIRGICAQSLSAASDQRAIVIALSSIVACPSSSGQSDLQGVQMPGTIIPSLIIILFFSSFWEPDIY